MAEDSKRLAFLRRVYADIINGYTLSSLGSRKFYVKHFSVTEQGLIDANYIDYYENALSKGILSDEAALNKCKSLGTWTDKDESFFESQKIYINNLFQTKKHLFVPSDIENYNNQIKEAHIALGKKSKEREEVIGFTAEVYASKKINELYIKYSHFFDVKSGVPLFDEESFSYLDDEELSIFINNYNKVLHNTGGATLKEIALKDFFQGSFGLCEDNIFHFYGKPISQLSFFQTELAAYGKYFKHILENSQPPEDLKKDPDKLIDWFTSSQNTKQAIDGTKGSVAVVGASSDDIQTMGAGKSFYDMVRGKKNLNATELMRLSGVKGV